MRRLIAVLVVVCAPLLAQQPAPTREDPKWVKEDVPKHVVYSVPGMDQARISRIKYKTAGADELEADLYTPARIDEGKLLPAIIFIHGGPLPSNLFTQPTQWGQYVSYGRLAAASGYIGITFNHRLYGMDRYPDAENDLADLISWIRTRGSSLHIDKDRVNLWAFSGGGPLLSYALRVPRPYIRSIVSYYSALDLLALRRLAPPSVSDETLRNFSPLHQLSTATRIPAIFIARLALDYPGQNETVDHFIQVAFAKNAIITIANHPTGHHGFDIDDDNDRSRQIIRSTFEFIGAQN